MQINDYWSPCIFLREPMHIVQQCSMWCCFSFFIYNQWQYSASIFLFDMGASISIWYLTYNCRFSEKRGQRLVWQSLYLTLVGSTIKKVCSSGLCFPDWQLSVKLLYWSLHHRHPPDRAVVAELHGFCVYRRWVLVGQLTRRSSDCPRSCASPRRRRPRTTRLSTMFWSVSTSRSSCSSPVAGALTLIRCDGWRPRRGRSCRQLHLQPIHGCTISWSARSASWNWFSLGTEASTVCCWRRAEQGWNRSFDGIPSSCLHSLRNCWCCSYWHLRPIIWKGNAFYSLLRLSLTHYIMLGLIPDMH